MKMYVFLLSLGDPNSGLTRECEVIDVLGSSHDLVDLGALNIYMPYIPISVSKLLACPSFSHRTITPLPKEGGGEGSRPASRSSPNR